MLRLLGKKIMTILRSKFLLDWTYEEFNSLFTADPYRGTLANSEDQAEMPHSAAFHQGLHCFTR